MAYNFSKRLKAIKGKTSWQFILNKWTIHPECLILDPSQFLEENKRMNFCLELTATDSDRCSKFMISLLLMKSIFKNYLAVLFLSCIPYSHVSSAQSCVIPIENRPAINQMLSELFDTTINEAQVTPLQEGGSGDKLFLISYCNNKIVVRIHQKNKNIKDKKLEYEASKNASDLGIGPKLLYVTKNYDLIVTEYITAKHPELASFQGEAQIHSLIEALLKLHNGPKLSNNWSIFEYIARITPKNLSKKEKLAIVELEKIKKAFKKNNFQNNTCHNDIHQANLFIIGNKILFIDWGDAGISDPFLDLARISIEFAFNPMQDEYLLTKYFGKVENLDKSHFFMMKQVCILRTAFLFKNMMDGPNEEKLKDIIKILEANSYHLKLKENEKVTWNYLSIHVMDLFLKNSKTNLYEESLKTLEQNSYRDIQ